MTHDENPLCQVGKTVGGKPITSEQFESIVSDVIKHLKTGPNEHLLDLCCGNGYLTSHIADHCKTAVGLDYSEPLLKSAIEHHRPENTTFLHGSVLDLGAALKDIPTPFTRVLMYEALQHFEKGDLETILRALLPHCADDVRLLFGSIPDKKRVGAFRNTWKYRLQGWWQGLRGRDAIGTWWTESEIMVVAERCGLKLRIHPQSSNLHTAHYRFDAVMTRGTTS